MKLRQTQKLSSPSRKRQKKGFALIATLTLMMLLAMLAVAIMATAASQNRIALQTMLQAEARQQALVGLDAAIGELQVELGPDQRVTANSGILDDNDNGSAQHLLGVWDSWDGPIYGKSVSGHGGKISKTYSKGRSDMFRRWMISSRDRNSTRSMNAAKQLCSRDPGQRICMVGEGTLGKSLSAQHYVYADLLKMPAAGKNEACFAWWIGGENQKAKASVQNREETNDVYEALRRTWDTPAPRFIDNRSLDFMPHEVEKPSRVLTLPSLPLLGSSSQAAGMPYFYDVTTTSYSLPVNVSMGGLKHDLCLLLNKESLRNTDFAARTNQDCPLVDNQQLPQGSETDMPIGSWQNLHAYYNCWPDGSADDSSNFTARLIGNLDEAYTRMSGSAYDDNLSYSDDLEKAKGSDKGRTYFDTRAMMETGSKNSGYARTPVMLAYLANFGLTAETSGTTAPKPADPNDPNAPRTDPLYNLSVSFAPMFLWWNPYNVPMRIRGQQLWARALPSKTAWIQTRTFSQKAPVKNWDDRIWWYRGIYRSNQNDKETKETLGKDYGEFFQVSESDSQGDIVFKPGEILFFSPAKARDKTGTKIHENPWVLGYNASAVSGYKATVYYHDSNASNYKQLGVASKTNIDDGNFYIDMRLGMPITAIPPGYDKPDVDNPEKEATVDKSGNAGYIGPDGFRYGPKRLDAITVLNGYAGMEKVVPVPEAINDDDLAEGKRGQSPHRGMLGWYSTTDSSANTVFCDHSRDDAYWKTDGSQSDNTVPYFVASLGIVPKSANNNLDARVYEGRDFRTKVWQHSSPAFWGSMITEPDDQLRQYHPYQLAALDVGAGMNACPMDNIGNNGVLGITSEGEQVSFASVLELPVHPPFSLAGFAGMRLQPGWYQTNKSGEFSAVGAARRMQYQAGVPGVGLGNAFADPCLPAEDVYTYYQNKSEFSDLSSNSRLFGDFYDHGLLINDAMWDRWFCSSVSDMPDRNGKLDAKEVLSDFLSGKSELPVSRYKRVNTPYNDQQIINRLMADDGWKYIAQYLMIDGGFNVNSVSEEAWTAVLQGLAQRKLVSSNANGNGLKFVEDGKGDNQVLFSRFMLSTTDKSVDGLGGYSMMQGSPSFREGAMAAAWGEVRMLEPESIRDLAEKIVEQVRKRGPFLSMSDFVNRRLEAGQNGLKGALQAAIDATDINRDFREVKVTPAGGGSLYRNVEAAEGYVHTAAPGYLIQSDVLASLGNILTVRDDTFTVRSYGCVRNPNKAILAQAWCEAVVQRTIDYVDPTNAPFDAEYEPDGRRGKNRLSNTNKVMGRQFRIVSFKWLDNWDI